MADLSTEEGDLYKDERFRDSVATINAEGKRNFLYPKRSKGPWMNKRSAVAYGLLAFLFAAPWIRIGGQPLLLLDVLGRRFVILGQVFWPQDSHLLVLSMLTGILFVIVFTVIFGRIFCGWICPQTIFMEHVFRKIEYWIDGDRGEQLRLARLPWNFEKIWKRTLKNGLFFGISFAIANTFLMYLIGTERWRSIVTDNPHNHLGGLATITVFTGVFFFVFAWFREQVCLIVCPYGRLQGVLLDRNSVVIAYDYVRGEKRGRFRKGENRAEADKGDCIDCGQCVDVCPTGIDIRNGTQLECINCAACIDVCNTIMAKTQQPKGLIRFASENQIAEKKAFRFTPRIIAYTGVLVVLLGVMGFLLRERSPIEATVLRAPGMLYQNRGEGLYSNLYNIKVVNKSTGPIDIDVVLISPPGRIEWVGTYNGYADVRDLVQASFFVYLEDAVLTGSNTPVELSIRAGDEELSRLKTNFNGPIR
ncbi:cytochrome c oxidase accessory protein CcoG [bacterium]|nr:cytochrome c oxidase accessory protein CcoG [bacterium]